jgi:hypothetical protein
MAFVDDLSLNFELLALLDQFKIHRAKNSSKKDL